MIITLYILHTFSFLAQILGGGIVVLEAKNTVKNIKTLKEGLDHAEELKEDHRQELKKMEHGRSISGVGGGRIQLPGIPAEVHEVAVEQTGPGGAAERRAVKEFVTAQFPNKTGFTWLGVVLLFFGIALGWIANMIGVNPDMF